MTIPAKLLLLFQQHLFLLLCTIQLRAQSVLLVEKHTIILLSKEFQLERQGSFSSSHFSNPIKKRAFCFGKLLFWNSIHYTYDVCDTERTNDNDKKSGKLNIIIFLEDYSKMRDISSLTSLAAFSTF